MSSSKHRKKLPKLGGLSAPNSYAEGTKIVRRKKTVHSAPPKRLNLVNDTTKPLTHDTGAVTIGHLSPVNLSRKSSISSLDKINNLYPPDSDLRRPSCESIDEGIMPPSLTHQGSFDSPRTKTMLSPVSITRKSCLDKINSRMGNPPACAEPVQSMPRMISVASQVSPKVAFSPSPPAMIEVSNTSGEDETEVKPPSPPTEGQRENLMTQSSARPSPSYQVPRKGVMASLARFGFISAMHTAKQIRLVNDTTVPLLYVVSSDLLARKIESLNFAAGSSGVSGGVSMNSRGVIHQVIPLQPSSNVEVQCRTDYNYLTIANRLPDGRFAVQRFQRQVQVGYVYTFSGNKMTQLDIRSASFIEDLTTK